MAVVELLGGLALLLLGGEALVRGSVGVATRLGVSPLLIGLTLVGFGTSMPELVTSLRAVQMGAPGIAIGNVVGSNIANVLLILGLSAVVLPVATSRRAFRRDGTVLMAASVLLLPVVLLGVVDRWVGFVFLAMLIAYAVYAYRTEAADPSAAAAPEDSGAAEPGSAMPLWRGAAIAVAGIAAVVFGAGLLVDSAVVLARAAGVSEAVIGLTLVALGTSLPEVATAVMAALRGRSDVAFGNVVGSNIFNILGILGTTAALSPIPVPDEIAGFDIWAMLAAALLLVVFTVTGWRINRWEGAAFLVAYAAYLAVQVAPGARASLGIA